MIRAAARITGGFVLIVVGIVGIILPIMPGWIFLFGGLVMLADYFAPARWLVDWGKRKYHWGREKAGWKPRPPGGA